jgi:hypothetical protein
VRGRVRETHSVLYMDLGLGDRLRGAGPKYPVASCTSEPG